LFCSKNIKKYVDIVLHMWYNKNVPRRYKITRPGDKGGRRKIMKAIRTVEWKTKDGRKIKAVIEVTREMNDNVAYADGWNINLGKKPYEAMTINITLDGKYIDTTYSGPTIVAEPFFQKDFITKIKGMGGYAKLSGKVIITEEIYNKIITAIAEATAEAGQDEEYKTYMNAKTAVEETARPAKEAREKELKETAIPQEAIEAYNRYRGDEDAAWEDANELAWSLIRQWTPYIEAQHGMHRGKLQRMINDAAREANYGINEG
jgi:hypothetical protein